MIVSVSPSGVRICALTYGLHYWILRRSALSDIHAAIITSPEKSQISR